MLLKPWVEFDFNCGLISVTSSQRNSSFSAVSGASVLWGWRRPVEVDTMLECKHNPAFSELSILCYFFMIITTFLGHGTKHLTHSRPSTFPGLLLCARHIFYNRLLHDPLKTTYFSLTTFCLKHLMYINPINPHNTAGPKRMCPCPHPWNQWMGI